MIKTIHESTIEDFGTVPRGWKVFPIKAIVNRSNLTNGPDLPLLSVYRDYGVILTSSRDDNRNKPSLDLSRYKVVAEGDLVINKMKAWQGSLGISKNQGIVSPAYYVCKINDYIKLDLTYLNYLLRSKPYISQYAKLSKGVRPGQWDLSFDDFKLIPLLVPRYQKQKRLASFLNTKLVASEKIIQEVGKHNQLWKLAKEYSQALISNVVTGKIKV